MNSQPSLPPHAVTRAAATTRSADFADLAALRRLEEAYLASGDPYRASGFCGGPDRWRQEREPILDAITSSGDLLDVGCANGLLLESLVRWAQDRNPDAGSGDGGITLVPYGVDVGPRLIAEARQRLPAFAGHFFVGDIWTWRPPRRFDYVYSVYDCAPRDKLSEYVELLSRAVLPGGRLVMGAYATPDGPAANLADLLAAAGVAANGMVVVGSPSRSAFVWIDC